MAGRVPINSSVLVSLEDNKRFTVSHVMNVWFGTLPDIDAK
jgi:hypothetical protein